MWSELPPELLSKIAQGLKLIDLFSFRHVCKAWNSAVSLACAEVEFKSAVKCRWFLMYGENSRCLLLMSGKHWNRYKKRYIHLPELEGTTCLASFLGWLLVFRQGKMFFFSPFTPAKIDLPDFPQSNLSNHVAAFSSPPTSQDCTVVVCHTFKSNLELDVLRRGETSWTKFNYPCKLHGLKAAAYDRGYDWGHYQEKRYFQFLDGAKNLVTFSPDEKVLHRYILLNQCWAIDSSSLAKTVFKNPHICREEAIRGHRILSQDPYICSHHVGLFKRLTYFVVEDLYICSRIGENLELDCDIKICGTMSRTRTMDDSLYLNERVNTNNEDVPRVARGVWLQPRFHHMSTTELGHYESLEKCSPMLQPPRPVFGRHFPF